MFPTPLFPTPPFPTPPPFPKPPQEQKSGSWYRVPHRLAKTTSPLCAILYDGRRWRNRSAYGGSDLSSPHYLRCEFETIEWAVQYPRRTGKHFIYRSVEIQVPLTLTLLAWIEEHQRLYVIPLRISSSVSDLDVFCSDNIEYNSVYNPYGSGAYHHWSNYTIHFLLGWCHTDHYAVHKAWCLPEHLRREKK